MNDEEAPEPGGAVEANPADVESQPSDDVAWPIGRLSSDGPFWVRAAACRQSSESPFQLRLLELTAGIRPDSWEARRWTYSNAAFVSDMVTQAEVSGWVRDGRIVVGQIDVPFEALLRPFRVDRRDSRQQSQYGALPWPAYEITLANLTNNEPPTPLISPGDAPSFVNLYTAAASFFGLEGQAVGGSLPQAAVVRWQDSRARINRVSIGSDELVVEVEGDALRGLSVELAGERPGARRTLWSQGTSQCEVATFPLPDGLPAGAWVLVRDGDEWLDRRHLAWPWARGTEAGVETEIEPLTKIAAYLANRENPTTEFKREVPTSEDGKARAMKTVCAYANGVGGAVLFGITDDYEIIGIPAAQIGRYIDQLTQMIDSWLEPTPAFTFNELLLEDPHFVVLELIVDAGRALYGSAKPNDAKRVYVRHYSTSVPARMGEVEAICRARNLSNSYR